jgi:hypothetical protein
MILHFLLLGGVKRGELALSSNGVEVLVSAVEEKTIVTVKEQCFA